uniref:Uncharacterized protein n=1 Tax=Knipowitschia caucasica TaxID=637954 RepID=A0AAV2LL66_KNICA
MLTNPQNSTAPALGSERTEEARDNTDVIGGLKSQIEQQISSQWEEVENQVTESHKHMMELLSAFQERRAVQVQMLENAVWNWKALEEFHSITSGITCLHLVVFLSPYRWTQVLQPVARGDIGDRYKDWKGGETEKQPQPCFNLKNMNAMTKPWGKRCM